MSLVDEIEESRTLFGHRFLEKRKKEASSIEGSGRYRVSKGKVYL
jgi:hypothetical protein